MTGGPCCLSKVVYKLHVGDVPVDGFWSISLYNHHGYFQKNNLNTYSLNNMTSKKGTVGTVDIQFGGCDGKVVNCLPMMPGWNYTVRLYRPHASILDGRSFRSPLRLIEARRLWLPRVHSRRMTVTAFGPEQPSGGLRITGKPEPVVNCE